MIIRRATIDDAAALAELAARTFRDAFGAMNEPDDLEAYCAKSYGAAQQRAEILDRDGITLVAEERTLIAFAQLHRSEARWGDVELARFYVERTHHGGGLAQLLMTATLAAARELGGRSIWLGVWERNPRGIAFYEKCGFEDVGSHPFVVGSDVQTDRVMVRPIGLR